MVQYHHVCGLGTAGDSDEERYLAMLNDETSSTGRNFVMERFLNQESVVSEETEAECETTSSQYIYESHASTID